MRRYITRTLIAAAAAGVTVTTLGFTAAGAASGATTGSRAFSPSGGTPIPTNANCVFTGVPADNCGMVGYEASARNFRFAQALITIPNHPGSIEFPGADPALYVALDNSGTNSYQYTRVGIAPCPASSTSFIVPNVSITCPSFGAGNTSDWIAFTATADQGALPVVTTHTISASAMGDGVLVNAYLTPTGNSVLTTITLPGGTTFHNSFAITGPVYTKAEALADWTTAVENDGIPEPMVPASKIRDSQFFAGRFTTMNGNRGTFAGPWMLNGVEATSNGILPPGGTLIGEPSSLWTNDARPGDAFGVWRFPF